MGRQTVSNSPTVRESREDHVAAGLCLMGSTLMEMSLARYAPRKGFLRPPRFCSKPAETGPFAHKLRFAANLVVFLLEFLSALRAVDKAVCPVFIAISLSLSPSLC